jgi:L-lactate dehydrogenase complex protein LldE
MIFHGSNRSMYADINGTAKKTPVTLFIPCLVDQVYPEIGLAMVKILRHFGYPLIYQPEQTCCGQPAFNAGHRNEARKVAGHFIDVFQNSETIVGPSGSCVAMIRNYYPLLFREHPQEEAALATSRNVFEFSEFLHRENLIPRISGTYSGKVGFHNSCHSYRELGISDIPLNILKQISGHELTELPGEPVCCGFGGLFSFKYEYVAAAMAVKRIDMFRTCNVDTIVSNDPGCIMHMRQEAIAEKIDMRIMHLTEFLVQSMKI